MHITQYGPGDEITWGPIISAADPRCDQDPSDEDCIQAIADEKFDRLTESDWQAERNAIVEDADDDDDLFLIARIAAASVTGQIAVRMLIDPIARERLEQRCRNEAEFEFDLDRAIDEFRAACECVEE
jgi:hypothetical protein